MATYIPNATQTTEPAESRTVESAALEFRTLKGSINSRIDTVQANLDAEEAARIAADTAETSARIATDAQLELRLDGLEGAYESAGVGGLPGSSYVTRFSGDGVTSTFSLDVAVPTTAVVDVYINGVYQHKNTFTVAATALTFSEAPPLGAGNIEVVYYVPLAILEPLDSSLVSYVPVGAGAIERTAQHKLRDTVSVKDFGAVGDGVTDDAVAIQAALDACVGSGLFFPAGTYIVGSSLNVPSNITLFGVGEQAVLKLKPQLWVGSSGLLLRVLGDTRVTLCGLGFDGNKGNVGSTRSPLIAVFDSQQVSVKDCTFRAVEGICLNVSTDCDDFTVAGCSFFNCGGDPSNSDGYRKQAIAFSTNGTDRAHNTVIRNCYFYRQGLDCISLNDCDNVLVTGNTSVESYSLLYNNPSPSYSTNVAVLGNTVLTCSEFGANTAVPPAALDLPSVKGLTVTGNSLHGIDSCGIGIFNNTENATVTGNVIVNPMRSSLVFKSAIFVGLTTNNVSVGSNTLVDTAVPPLMSHGVVFGSTSTNLVVSGNLIRNPLASNIGYYTSSPGTVSAFTSASPADATARVVDCSVGNNLETTYGRVYVEGATPDPLVRITQTGTGNCFVVQDSATPDNTAFSISADGKVGIRVSPAVFNSALSVAETGATETASLLNFGADSNSAQLRGYKTRETTPYGHGLLIPGDEILSFVGFASDGTIFRQAAKIVMRADSAAAGDVAGNIGFLTVPVGDNSPVERFRVKPGGQVRFVPLASAPASSQAGDVYYDSTTNKLRCYNGTTWNDLF